ncbi:SusC/RagA family TonB-linked outer membrane protein [Niastella koreensis]|nr:TonB-dependent receptor [Niastella koreensis]
MVKGKVTDEKGNAVPGATILVKGTDKTSLAKGDGSFAIPVITGNETLVVSSIGFAKTEIPLNGQTTLTVSLTSEKSQLEDVVVVGYGTARKRDITGAVATFNPKGIEEKPIARVDQALIGQMPGVQIKQQTGMPGGGFSVQVRGAGSISAGTEPLYVIDGFPLDVVSQSTSGGFAQNPLNNINPNDIESIQVLKDAAAGAIYGSRAANGVVIITTKRGQIGKARISVNAYTGLSKVAKKLDVLSADEWIAQATELANYKWVASGNGTNRTATQTNEERRVILGLAPGQVDANFMTDDRWTMPGHPGLQYIDWQDQAFRTANFQNYELSASGGTDNVRYFFSGNYLNQGGVLINSGFKNFSARANVEVNASNKFKLGFNLAPTYSETNLPLAEGKDNQLMKLYNMSPVVEDTAGVNTGAGNNQVYKWASSSVSPVAYLNNMSNLVKNTRILYSMYGDYQIVKGLSLRTTVNYDESNVNTKRYISDYVGGNIANYQTFPGKSASGMYSGYKKQNFVNENTITYIKTINDDHTINVVGGMSYNYVHLENFTLSTIGGQGFTNSSITTINYAASSATGTVTGNTTETNNALVSYYGRAQYAYTDKYLLQASIRRDASSRFGENNRWGTFPSLSVGWRISRENFMRTVNFVNDLKLRASWGQAGNYSIGDYSSQALLTAGNYSFGGNTVTVANGQVPKSIPNPDLQWEKANTYDVGFDASLLNNRINIVFDAYQKKNTNLLLNVPVVSAAGFPTALQNIGAVVNRGLELGLNTTNLSKHDFQWTTNFNIAYNQNKVFALGADGADINVATNGLSGNPPFLLSIGKPMYSYYLVKTNGILTQDDINDPKVAKLPKQTVGDEKYVDANPDGIIDARDRVVAGQPSPKYTFGMTNNFRYKSFDLSVQMYGQTGGTIYSFLGRAIDNPSNGRNTNLGVWRDRWTADNQNYNAPRGKIGFAYTIPLFTTDWLYSSNFLRIQNITLGYNLKKLIKTGAISNARVYASAQNPFGWDKYKGGVNPEAQNTQVGGSSTSFQLPGDYGAMPLNKTITVGVNVSF